LTLERLHAGPLWECGGARSEGEEGKRRRGKRRRIDELSLAGLRGSMKVDSSRASDVETCVLKVSGSVRAEEWREAVRSKKAESRNREVEEDVLGSSLTQRNRRACIRRRKRGRSC